MWWYVGGKACVLDVHSLYKCMCCRFSVIVHWGRPITDRLQITWFLVVHRLLHIAERLLILHFCRISLFTRLRIAHVKSCYRLRERRVCFTIVLKAHRWKPITKINAWWNDNGYGRWWFRHLDARPDECRKLVIASRDCDLIWNRSSRVCTQTSKSAKSNPLDQRTVQTSPVGHPPRILSAFLI